MDATYQYICTSDLFPVAVLSLNGANKRVKGNDDHAACFCQSLRFCEQGFPGFEAMTWAALVAPAGTPAPVVERLNQAANKALVSKELTERLRPLLFDPLPGTPAALEPPSCATRTSSGGRRSPPPAPRSTETKETPRHDATVPPDEPDRLHAGAELLQLRRLVAPPVVDVRLHVAGILPAHRPHAGGRQVRPGLLRRSPGDARHLRRRPSRDGRQRHARREARPDHRADGHGRGDDAARPGLDLLDDLLRAVPCRAPVRDARPDDRRAASPGTS